MRNKIVEVLVGIILTICLALSSFSLGWTFRANADLKLLEHRVTVNASDIQSIEAELKSDHRGDHH